MKEGGNVLNGGENKTQEATMSIKQSQPNQGFLNKTELIAEKQELKMVVDDKAWGMLNDTQLWFIYLGLNHLGLEPDLQIGVNDLKRRIHSYGVRNYEWQK